MNLALSFDADLSDWLRAFGNVERKIADATPAHELIGDRLVDESRQNIADEGGAARWPELAPSTLPRRHKKYPNAGDKMLYVTGELYQSMQKDVHSDYVDVGSPLVKARSLFEGRAEANIPPRSPFTWRNGVLQEVGSMYIYHLFGELR